MATHTHVSPTASVPTPRTPLLGRETERAASQRYLLDEAVPLLTLTGPGGVGKTRLALTLTSDVAASFADGVCWVDLAPLRDPALVALVVAMALGIMPTMETTVTNQVITRLRPQQLLLLLDNCEHLVEATAELVGQLLASCPALQVLATSRAPLRVHGEQLLPVEPFHLPLSHAWSRPALEANTAVRLFTARAQAIRPGIILDDRTLDAVAALCRRLDGLPLAIELAAARSAILSPQELLTHMDQRPSLLTHGARDLPARHQTITATIAWSYDLLNAGTQACFRRLAVFAGGFTHKHAQDVVADGNEASDRVLDHLEVLVEHSLIRPTPREDGIHFTILETLREYAMAQLEAAGEVHRVRDAHADVFIALVDEAMPHIHGPEAAHWHHVLDMEQDNIRAALAWLEQSGDGTRMLRLALVGEHWLTRGQLAEGRQWLERALALGGDPEARLPALIWASGIACFQRDAVQAEAWAHDGLALSRDCGVHAFDGRLLYALQINAWLNGDLEEAIARGERAVVRLRELNDTIWLAFALGDIGTALLRHGQVEKGTRRFEEALTLHRAQGNVTGIGVQSNDMAGALLATGSDAMLPFLRESLQLMARLGSDLWIAGPLAGLANLIGSTEDITAAVSLLAVADRLRRDSGTDMRTPEQREASEQTMAQARSVLGEPGVAAAWQAGTHLPTEDAVTQALTLSASLEARPIALLRTSSPPQSAALPGTTNTGLSPREHEVLALLCQRLTDAEIAATLFISPKTAGHHVSHILTKLGAANRREAAATAVRQHLI